MAETFVCLARALGEEPWPDADEIERLQEIEQAARDLVALWQAQKVSGLPRADRNAAIEECRNRLIELLGRS